MSFCRNILVSDIVRYHYCVNKAAGLTLHPMFAYIRPYTTRADKDLHLNINYQAGMANMLSHNYDIYVFQ